MLSLSNQESEFNEWFLSSRTHSLCPRPLYPIIARPSYDLNRGYYWTSHRFISIPTLWSTDTLPSSHHGYTRTLLSTTEKEGIFPRSLSQLHVWGTNLLYPFLQVWLRLIGVDDRAGSRHNCSWSNWCIEGSKIGKWYISMNESIERWSKLGLVWVVAQCWVTHVQLDHKRSASLTPPSISNHSDSRNLYGSPTKVHITCTCADFCPCCFPLSRLRLHRWDLSSIYPSPSLLQTFTENTINTCYLILALLR